MPQNIVDSLQTALPDSSPAGSSRADADKQAGSEKQSPQAAQAAEAKSNLLADSLAATPMAFRTAQQVNIQAVADAIGKPEASTNTAAGATSHKNAEQDAPMSYLEAGIDKLASRAIKDKSTRQSFDHDSTEFLTTAALFAGGKVGLAGTVILYGLSSARPDEKPLEQVEDFALGAVRGAGTRLIFAGAKYLPTAPLKGVVTGIGSRALGDIVSRDTFSDPGKSVAKLKSETFSGQSMLADAVTWTVGEGLFHGSNYLSGGRLGQNPLVKGVTMGASFGAVNGSNAEIAREKAKGESIDVTKVIKQGLIEAAISGAAAGGGMRASMSLSRSSSVHVTEVRSDGSAAKSSGGAEVSDKEAGLSISLNRLSVITGGAKTAKMIDIPGMAKTKSSSSIPDDIFGETPGPKIAPESANESGPESTVKQGPASGPKSPLASTAREFVIDSSKHDFKNFRNRKADGALLNVRELLKGADGKDQLGPKKLLFVQKLGTGGDNALKEAAAKADIVVTSHPEVLSQADRAKHIFPDGEGKVWLAMSGNGSKGSTLRLATGDVKLSQWSKEGFVDPIRLDNGNVSLSVMAPLLVGDPKDINGDGSKGAWTELDRQLAEAKKLGIDAVSTDVWWGLIEPKKGEFDWSYYEKLSDHIKQAGLKWVPILSFHQCGGNVGDDANVPLPPWIWGDVAAKATNGDTEGVKYKSEQGHTSPEYVSLFADNAVMDNYANVMKEFQGHFASKAQNIGEVNVSLGPAGELRYPSYNAHDNNTGYPTRGALQSYSDLAIASFREYVDKKYGGHDGVGKAWGIENLDDSHILPPGDAGAFFGRGDHFNTQYGRDFMDWYNQSLIDHGQRMLSTAVSVFGQKGSPFYGIDLGAKVPGVHWRVGDWQNGNVVLGDRQAELSAGLIATSRGDWDNDADGRGYRPILSMFKGLQPLTPGLGNRIVPGFTCLEMPDGDGGPAIKAMPHSLATWVGEEAERQGLWLKGENALNGNLSNSYSWDLMRGFLTLPNQHGLYHGLTFLRMGDIVNNGTARDRVSQINNARVAFESIRQSIRQIFAKAA